MKDSVGSSACSRAAASLTAFTSEPPSRAPARAARRRASAARTLRSRRHSRRRRSARHRARARWRAARAAFATRRAALACRDSRLWPCARERRFGPEAEVAHFGRRQAGDDGRADTFGRLTGVERNLSVAQAGAEPFAARRALARLVVDDRERAVRELVDAV